MSEQTGRNTHPGRGSSAWLYTQKKRARLSLAVTLAVISVGLTGCGGSGSGGSESDESADTSSQDVSGDTVTLSELDEALLQIIEDRGLAEDTLTERELPGIDDPLARLGRALFFSKSLSGDFDVACASCHHPTLGGADALSLSIGVEATDPDLLGPGRENASGDFPVPRHAPTVFNTGLWDTGLFTDSRVESLGQEPGTNGSLSGIRTPDTLFGVADPDAGPNLAAAQARFPVTSPAEMLGDTFESGSNGETVRAHLAARLGDYGAGLGELADSDWLDRFREAFGVTASAETLITFDNIALAIGEYERSMVFTDNPWQQYLEGDPEALSDSQKEGAILFFTRAQDGGAGCGACHNGPLFSDGQHHTVSFPQFGPGLGDGVNDDFGRERETGDALDRYRFRTPSLLNIADTAPYGHTGSFASLERVVRHYVNPANSIERFFDRTEWCDLPQFAPVADCEDLFPDSRNNSELALAKLQAEQAAGTSRLGDLRLSNDEVNAVVAFLQALTDPCVTDESCIADWIADPVTDDADGHLLVAEDEAGNRL